MDSENNSSTERCYNHIMIEKFLNKSGAINPNATRKMTELETSAIRENAQVFTASINTAIYCIHHNIKCKTCKTCGGEMSIENFIMGWRESQHFCSLKCKYDYKPELSTDDAIFTDYESLLDVNGNPAREKIYRHMNPASIAHLKSIANVDSDHFNTNLFVAMGRGSAKKCLTCSKTIDIANFQTGYRDNQNFCSYECKDRNEVTRRAVGDQKRGISRYDNQNFYNTKSVWYEKKKEILKDSFDVDVQYSFDEYLADKKNIPMKCCQCGNISIADFSANRNLFCRLCHPKSKEQTEIAKFVKSLGFEITIDDRKTISPNEIDILVRDKNIGIEYDGFYWHDGKNDKPKFDKMSDLGIRYLKIFQDEYYNKREIVLSKIENVLGKTPNKIYARKCVIREIDYVTAFKFMEETHIQGAISSTVYLGLFLNDELVAHMSFGKSRFNKQFEWEMHRYSTKLRTNVVGGASKLLKYFRSKYTGSIITYCDLRYGVGKMYESLGFKYTHTSDCGYFYFKHGVRHSRVKFQKHKLADVLDVFDPMLSESENMSNNGYLKIFDLGNKVYTLE